MNAFFNEPMRILSGSGFVLYGGIIGGILAAIMYCKSKRVNFFQYFDLTVPSVALAQGFGRIGCFLAGCCYGRETDSAIGIVFHNSSIAPNGIKLIPTQLLSSAGDFLIVIVLLLYARKDRKTGKVGALYLILYSVGRFIIEFFRNDYRGSIGILSTSQLISLIILAIGTVMFFRKELPWANEE
jgi:phosphatidylglycerol:prolipoprotein diacylglycerol transferase